MSLEFGIILGDLPVTVEPAEHLDILLRQVETAQRAGFRLICIGQHFLYESYRWLQPIPLLARLATETDAQVRLAATVLIVPLHHPVLLAEEIATLDIVCGGRLSVGVGTGYRKDEFGYLGVPYEERYPRLEESLELMSLLWSQETVTFEGRFWQLHGAPTHVRPVQQPRPPVWLGAMKPFGVRRAARVADAWTIPPGTSFAEVAEGIAVFDAERERLGLEVGRARHPLRREIVIGTNVDDAVEVYAGRARERYLAYATREHPTLSKAGFEDGFRGWALERAVLGSPADCIETLAGLDLARLGPVIVRPVWPGQPVEEGLASIEQLGEQVVSAFR